MLFSPAMAQPGFVSVCALLSLFRQTRLAQLELSPSSTPSASMGELSKSPECLQLCWGVAGWADLVLLWALLHQSQAVMLAGRCAA